MRFWTIQPREIWEQMQHGHSVRVNPDHPKYRGTRPWQYEWLADALHRHCPGFDGGWPWWLHCIPPDLEQCRTRTHPGGKEQAYIELELPEERRATFPLWMWETIYTGQYLALTRAAFDAWSRLIPAAISENAGADDPGINHDGLSLPEPWRDQIKSSWEHLFAHDHLPRFWYRDEPIPDADSPFNHLRREATEALAGLTQELRASDVASVTLFEAFQ